MNEVIQHRTQNSESFIATDGALMLNLEYLPWTAAAGEEGVADALLLQVFIFIFVPVYYYLLLLLAQFNI